MKYKNLAIKGHSTRGKEVIQILEMLGGNNRDRLNGRSLGFYCIDCNNNIDFVIQSRHEFMTFYLEEFLEKYPYKVGDKVKNARINDFIGRITNVRWDDNEKQIIYVVEWDDVNKSTLTYFATGLQPYEEEIKAEDRLKIYTDHTADDSKTDIIINGEKLIAPKGYTIGNATRNSNKLIVEYIKNKPQYPKTYEECYAILNQNLDEHSVIGYRSTDVYNLQLLLICRDAYWKIAGEEMGLLEPWKPDWYDEYEYKFVIMCSCNDITKESYVIKNAILAFPTEEMRDAFFENFKDLIEKCKEFL
jgi:hypothetical protein